jgi:hypothetical protein
MGLESLLERDLQISESKVVVVLLRSQLVGIGQERRIRALIKDIHTGTARSGKRRSRNLGM